jgi:hypothetical protein
MSVLQNPNTDPVQAMLAQTSLSRTQYLPTSRYYGSEIVSILRDGGPVAYLRRRFIPQPSQFQTEQVVTVQQGDRPDLLAATYLGDPTLFWRLCDANRIDRPPELTATPGAAVRITLPVGITGAAL